MAARFFAFLSHCSRIRRVAAPSVITFVSVFAERFAPHLCRVALISCASLSLHHLIESRLLVTCVAQCVAGLIALPRRCRVRWRCSLFFCLSARQPLPRSKSARLCYSRLANTTRIGLSLESCRLSSTSLAGGECRGYLLVLATVLRCRALHIIVDSKSRIYILLLNIFSPRVTRVTRIYL